MAVVFVSYRRGAAAGSAGRLYDALAGRLGEAAVFMDVADIQPGDDFVEVLDRTLAACRAIAVVIDPAWLDVHGRHGWRRLDDPRDYVRLEIEHALRLGLRIVPVLVDGAAMPGPDDLPTSIRALAHRNAVTLTAARFRHDAGLVADAVERAMREPAPRGRVPDRSGPVPVADPGADDPAAAPLAGVLLFLDASSRSIAASRQVVWDALVDLTGSIENDPIASAVEPISFGPPRSGYRFLQTGRGSDQTFEGEMIRFDPPAHLTTTTRWPEDGLLEAATHFIVTGAGTSASVRVVSYLRFVSEIDRVRVTPILRQWLDWLAQRAEAEQARRPPPHP